MKKALKVLFSILLFGGVSFLGFKSYEHLSFNYYLSESSAEFREFHNVIKNNCLNCHGDYGLYKPKDWINSGLIFPNEPQYSKLFTSLRGVNAEGDRDMPPFKTLAKEETLKVENFINSLPKQDIDLTKQLEKSHFSFSPKEKLSNEEIFKRCHMQLTGKRVKENSTALRDIREGKISPSQACYKFLTEAVFKNSKFEFSNKELAQDTRDQIHRFNTSWLKDYGYYRDGESYVSHEIFPYDEAALYITNTLWNNLHYKEVLDNPNTLKPVRNIKTTPKVHIGYESRKELFEIEKYRIGDTQAKGQSEPFDFKWIGRGHLTDIEYKKTFQKVRLYVNRDSNIVRYEDGLVLDKSLYGANGSQSYILHNISRDPGEKSNGGLVMPRSWAKKVLRDFMCRSLPVVNLNDTVKYTNKSSAIKFRAKNTCMQCHTTIDQMSGALRHAQVVYSSSDAPTSIHVKFYDTKYPDSGNLLPDKDDKYFLRPKVGKFVYRTVKGELISKEFEGLDQLNKIITSTDDYYNCAASKYLYFMTGIEFNFENFMLPNKPLDKKSEYLLSKIFKLGENLKRHGDLKILIKEIIELDLYQQEDFGNF
jgi:hypothetical protein